MMKMIAITACPPCLFASSATHLLVLPPFLARHAGSHMCDELEYTANAMVQHVKATHMPDVQTRKRP